MSLSDLIVRLRLSLQLNPLDRKHQFLQ
jgi:hypothetical protein